MYMYMNSATIIIDTLLFLFQRMYFAFINGFKLTKTPLQGAQTTIYCAVSEEMEGVTGKYLADCKITKTLNPQAEDDQLAERLWEVSEMLTQDLYRKFSLLSL